MRACQAGPFSQFGAEACCCPGRPGRLSALSVFLGKSVFYGVFVWARRALNSQKWRSPARVVAERFAATADAAGAETAALRQQVQALTREAADAR